MKIRKVLTLDESVCNRIAAYAEENGLSFSGAVSVLAGQALQAQKGMDGITQLVRLIEQEKATNSLSAVAPLVSCSDE